MAYEDDEVSVRRGAPRELYRFEGTYATYRYTSSTKVIRYQAPDEDEVHSYLPITLERSEVNAGTNADDGLDLTVDLPVASDLAVAYAFNTSPPDLRLTVFRYHSIDDVRPYWRGNITNLNIDNGVVTLTSPSSLGRAMTQQFPNVYYQAPCNHTLYDKRCKVLYALWSTETTIYAVEDTTITILPNDRLTGNLANALVGGEFVLPTGERRMIVTQGELLPEVPATDTKPAIPARIVIGLNFPFGLANVGTSVTLAAGCDYAFTGDCKVKFDNQLNFGGFPFVSEDNIFETSAEPPTLLPDNTCLAQCATTFTLVGTDEVGVTISGYAKTDVLRVTVMPSPGWTAFGNNDGSGQIGDIWRDYFGITRVGPGENQTGYTGGHRYSTFPMGQFPDDETRSFLITDGTAYNFQIGDYPASDRYNNLGELIIRITYE